MTSKHWKFMIDISHEDSDLLYNMISFNQNSEIMLGTQLGFIVFTVRKRSIHNDCCLRTTQQNHAYFIKILHIFDL